MRLDIAGFNIFDKIKKQIFTTTFSQKIKELENMHDRKIVEEA